MTAPLFLGIDGGGSNLRVAIVDDQLQPLATHTAGPANPSIIGHARARQHIRRSVETALRQAGVAADSITAAGIGIAGASNLHSRQWLLDTLSPLLANTQIAPSSDLEIALVGALARRHGILLLAGTGSAVYGCAPKRRQLQIGGWGYLLGDEGSGYWIGLQLLRGIIRAHDEGAKLAPLYAACLSELGLSQAREVVGWLYRSQEAATTRLAELAPLALDMADAGDRDAQELLRQAGSQLARQVEQMRRRLDAPAAPIGFAGGLLDNHNPLSLDVTQRLNLPTRPIARHSPVIGAALLAKLEWSRQ